MQRTLREHRSIGKSVYALLARRVAVGKKHPRLHCIAPVCRYLLYHLRRGGGFGGVRVDDIARIGIP